MTARCVAGGEIGLLRHAAPPLCQPPISCLIIPVMGQKTNRPPAHNHAPNAAALATTSAPDGALATSPPTTRRLAAHSLSANTRAAYTRAVRQFDAWRGAAPATDATLAAYIGALFEQGRAPATAALAVAAVTFRAALTKDTVRGPLTDRVLAGFRRDGADRGRGQAALLLADAFAAILATANQRRETGRGRESARIAARRAALDKALAAVLFQGALRRSEAAALEWRDIAPATTAGAILLTVRRSKTNQEGTAADVRYLKAAAKAVRAAARRRRPDHPRLRRPDAPAARAPLHRRRPGRGHRRPAHRPQRPGGPGLRAHRPRRLDRGRHAGRGVENRADGRPLQRRGHRGTRGGRALPVAPGATGCRADGRTRPAGDGAQEGDGATRRRHTRRRKKDALRFARSTLERGGDARGTGPPDPAGLRHPRLSVRGRNRRGAAAQKPRDVIGQREYHACVQGMGWSGRDTTRRTREGLCCDFGRRRVVT